MIEKAHGLDGLDGYLKVVAGQEGHLKGGQIGLAAVVEDAAVVGGQGGGRRGGRQFPHFRWSIRLHLLDGCFGWGG